MFRAYLKAAGASEFGTNDCLPEPELFEYHRGGGTVEEKERVQFHLIGCRACRERLLDIAAFCDPPREGEMEWSPREVNREWHRFERRLKPQTFPSVERWLPVAASVVLMSLLGWSLVELRVARQANHQLAADLAAVRQRGEAGREPRLNASVHDLYNDFIRRSSGAVGQPRQNIVRVAPGTTATLILHVPQQPARSRYALEIMDSRGATVWRGEPLARTPDGFCTVSVLSDFLIAGKYQFHVLGLGSDGTWATLAEYPVEWAHR